MWTQQSTEYKLSLFWYRCEQLSQTTADREWHRSTCSVNVALETMKSSPSPPPLAALQPRELWLLLLYSCWASNSKVCVISPLCSSVTLMEHVSFAHALHSDAQSVVTYRRKNSCKRLQSRSCLHFLGNLHTRTGRRHWPRGRNTIWRRTGGRDPGPETDHSPHLKKDQMLSVNVTNFRICTLTLCSTLNTHTDTDRAFCLYSAFLRIWIKQSSTAGNHVGQCCCHYPICHLAASVN